MSHERWALRRWLGWFPILVDQVGNWLTGGSPDETISSRAGRGQRTHWHWRWLCRALDWADPGHCQKAVESERARTHLSPEARAELERRILEQHTEREEPP